MAKRSLMTIQQYQSDARLCKLNTLLTRYLSRGRERGRETNKFVDIIICNELKKKRGAKKDPCKCGVMLYRLFVYMGARAL